MIGAFLCQVLDFVILAQVTKIQARLEEVESEATAAKEEAATLREVR